MAGMPKFNLVKLTELEDSFAQQPTKKDMRNLSKNTGIPAEFLIHEVVFAAPDCTMAKNYIDWTQANDAEHVCLRTRTMNVTSFEQVHGPDAVHQFLRAMIVNGHPYQPVRVVRDSRQPTPTTLEDSHVYVAP